jgi:hypothetical protein
MKKRMIMMMVLLGTMSLATLNAQTCTAYYPIKQGTITEMTSYDAKGKVTGSSRSTVLTNVGTADGYVVNIKSESFDDKGVASGSSEYSYSCAGGKFLINMKGFFNPATMAAYKDMDLTIDATDIDMPSNPTVGEVLKEGTLTMKASTNGFQVMNMTLRMYNRKVAAIETITTSAGTFECIKITYDMETSGMFRLLTKGVEWYAKEVGAVKTESYDANGKLTGSSQLTKITR